MRCCSCCGSHLVCLPDDVNMADTCSGAGTGPKVPPGSAGSLRPPNLPPFRPVPAPRPPPAGAKPQLVKAPIATAPLRRPLPPPRPRAEAAPPVAQAPAVATADAINMAAADTAGRTQQVLPGPKTLAEDPEARPTGSEQESGPAPAVEALVPAVQPEQTEHAMPPRDAWPGYRASDTNADVPAASSGPPSPFAAAQSGSASVSRETFELERAASDRCDEHDGARRPCWPSRWSDPGA